MVTTGSGSTHEFLEHTGEVQIRVRGSTLAAVLAEAGRALGELELRGQRPAAPLQWREVEVSSADREALLVEWLNELIFLAETNQAVAVEFHMGQTSDSAVRARVGLVSVEESPSLVKAATYHQVRVAETADGLVADVIVDV